MTSDNCIAALVSLGFTALEGEIYTFLLRESPVTGYRVAQALGKPTANTYKAIESLALKGAVMVAEGENRHCRAVPAPELLSKLERRFSVRRQRAAEALSQRSARSVDDRLYQLRSRDQVTERGRSMIGSCTHVAVMDLSPTVLVGLRDDLEQAARRGVEVVVKTYEKVGVDGARVVVRPRGHEIIDSLPGELISLNVDGAEHLLALLAPGGDDVFQAIWTGSAIISYLLYNGLVNEVSQVAVMRELEGDTSVDAIHRAFHGLRHLHPTSSKGVAYQNLMRHLGAGAPNDVGPQKDAGMGAPRR